MDLDGNGAACARRGGCSRGRPAPLTAAALEGAASAIRLALGLAGALCLWSGAAKALERAGGMRALARLARPVFRRLFPQTAQDETAMAT